MVDEINQDKTPPARSPKAGTPVGTEGAPFAKAKKPSRGIFGLFKRKKDRAAPAGAAKAKGDGKKLSLTLPSFLNVQKINLQSVNIALIAVLVVLIGLMFFVAFKEKPEIRSVVDAVSRIKLPSVEHKPVEKFQELSYYLDEIKHRNIFNAYVERQVIPVKTAEPVKEPEPLPEPAVPIEQKAKNLKLIGISWGNNPKAMLRETDSQNVIFVGVGETIDGTDITVSEILKNEVILSSEGQEMSLL